MECDREVVCNTVSNPSSQLTHASSMPVAASDKIHFLFLKSLNKKHPFNYHFMINLYNCLSLLCRPEGRDSVHFVCQIENNYLFVMIVVWCAQILFLNVLTDMKGFYNFF